MGRRVNRSKGVFGVAVLLAGGALPAAGGSASSKQTSPLIHNGMIVFSRDAPGDQGTTDLYAISSRGGAPRLLVGGDGDDFSVSWSPDGSRFVFDRVRGPSDDLVEKVVVANADGSNVREIADGGDPVWSPAGGEIAYVNRGVWPAGRIFVIHPDGTGRRALTPARLDAITPAWSPSGRQLAFNGGRPAGPDRYFVYLVDKSGRHLRRLTPVRTFGDAPAWSPDGKLLAFSGGNDRYTKLFVANAKGGKTRMILARPTASLGSLGSIGWSRDGATIAFEGAIGTDTQASFAVYLVRSSGFGMKRVRRVAYGPRWSPDGRDLVFSAFYRRSYAFEIVNSSGRIVRWIDTSTTARDYDPSWQPLP